MAESTIAVTPGAGIKIHSWNRTIGANSVDEEFFLPGEYPLASYTIFASNISIATAADHVCAFQAGSSLNVRVRSVKVEQNATATTVLRATFELIRLSSAGTGGSAITPAKHDTADAAAGCTAQSLPTVKGTETTSIRQEVLIMRQALAATGTQPEESLYWQQQPNAKPWIIAAGTANGFAIKSNNAVAAATVNVTIEIVETSFL